VLLLASDQYSNYNGLQITGSMRPWHHVSFSGFYTLSKTMTSAQLQNNTTQGGAQNYTNIAEEYGRADTDQRHVFAMNVNWDVDYYRGANALVRGLANGWMVAPIIKLRSGLPFSVTNGGVDANLDGNTTDRAELVGDPSLSNPTAAEWFNTSAFARNPAVTGQPVDGNSARNLLDGPGYKDVDLAVSRTVPVRGTARLTFRVEATNAFNVVNLGQPGNSVNSNTFGVIRTAGSMRKVQLGVRLTF